MPTLIQWFVPCYTDVEGFDKEQVINLDLIEAVKHANINISDNEIIGAEVQLLTKFQPGRINHKRIVDFVEGNCGKIFSYFKAPDCRNWDEKLGCVNIRIKLRRNLHSIPNRSQIKAFYNLQESMNPDIDSEFIKIYHESQRLLKEFSSLFLSALHLTFPTRHKLGWYQSPVNDGIFHINSKRKNFFDKMPTDNFMHKVLIEKDKLKYLKSNIISVAQVWNKNIWSLRRYLLALKSNFTDIDNLMDLIYALEGLFGQNTSSDVIKIFCAVKLGKSRHEAEQIKSILDSAFKARNEIAHGGKYFNPTDNVKGKSINYETIFWNTKTIVAQMIVLAIKKCLSKKGMENLHFSNGDIFEMYYNKP